MLCLRFDLKNKGDYLRAFVVPEMQYAVVRMEEVSESNEYFSQTDVEYSLVDGLFLPASYEYSKKYRDEIFESEKTTLVFLSTNDTIQKSLFTVAGISPQKNTFFVKYPPDQKLGSEFQWDGEKLVPTSFPIAGSRTLEVEGSRSLWRNLLIINSIIFLLLAVFLYLKSKRFDQNS